MAGSRVFLLLASIHRFDPVIIRFNDSLQLRWYGLAYVLGFLAGFWLLRRWARRGVGGLKEKEVADFITYAALFGVLLGGRLGWALLYGIREENSDPWWWVKVWKGGMASHGGIIGLFFFTLYWARTRKASWTGLGDNLVVAAPVGLFAGRMANFVNGELYGRATDVSWAMKFPDEAERLLNSARPEDLDRVIGIRTLLDEFGGGDGSLGRLVLENDEFATRLEPLLTSRHPSQLYAAALEGVALFLILFIVREKWPRAPHGLLTALFFLLYAAFRIFGEQFREPDAYIAGLTEGQFYSTFMILIGAVFLVFALKQKRWPVEG